MEAPQQTFVTDDEETLVTPRFDDEETILARPVVPLTEAAAREQKAPAAASHTPARTPLAARRSWVLALAVASAFAGSVLGGAGFYLYQNRAHAAPASAPPAQTSAPVANSQPVPAPTVEAASDTAAVNSLPPGVTKGEVESHEPTPAPPADSAENAPPKDTDKNAVGNSPADSARSNAEDARAVSPKHGKKGDGSEAARSDRRANDSDDDAQLSRDDRDAPNDNSDDPVFSRPRRAARREQARRPKGFMDRLRRIFEGQP
jgi:hypothetical protein